MINLMPTRENYYVQVNNEVNPYSACNVTCMTMVIDYVMKGNMSLLNKLGKFAQPEDNLYVFMDTDPDIQAYYKRLFPKSDVPPQEYLDVMCYTMNKLYGNKIKATVDIKITVNKLISDLTEEQMPAICSLRFPERRIPGHFIVVCGVDDEGNFICNDPYKNTLKNLPDGFNNIYPQDEFLERLKWGIRFKRV